jgi:hypothetical protein
MKTIKNKWFLPILGIIMGTAIVLAGNVYAVALNGKAPLFLAVGGGIFGISLSKLLYLISNYFTARQHPQLHRAQNIELKDERNILVKDKAGAKTNILMLDLIFILTFVFAFMSIALWVTATMAGLMLINIVAHTIFARYYDKRL